MARHSYVIRVLLGLDQLGNTLLGGNEDETISSRVGRNAIAGKRWARLCEILINALFHFIAGQHGHCRSAIEWDELSPSQKGAAFQCDEENRQSLRPSNSVAPDSSIV